MEQYITKATVIAEIERRRDAALMRQQNLDAIGQETTHNEMVASELNRIISFIDTLEVKEVDEKLAKTYLQVFDKKFPILLTLKGKQLDKFKNFLNRCQQIFGLQEWGIHPIQAKLFEKLTLLWAAWGAEHLQGIGNANGEFDRCGLTWQDIKGIAEIGNDFMNSEESNDLDEEEYYTGILKKFLGKKVGEKL